MPQISALKRLRQEDHKLKGKTLSERKKREGEGKGEKKGEERRKKEIKKREQYSI
jgi:hypothetical protein